MFYPIRYALILALLSRVISMALPPQEKQTALSIRQSDAICGNCHQAIFRNYLRTPMANASGLAADRVVTGAFHHSASGIDYQVSVENRTVWLTYSRRSVPPLEGRRRLDYFLGSGHLGITYLFALNGYLLESPVAYYNESRSYDMKPGLAAVETMPSALPMTRGCMRCHMSGVQREDPGTLNHFRDLPFLYGGITCESCHGDSREHISSSGKTHLLNPANLETDRRDSICVSCHLEGDTRIEHAGRSVDDFKPGDRITDFLSYFVLSRDQLTNRGVSEIEQFSFSQCKRVSGSRMSCTNCHDPHFSPLAEERIGFYRKKCLSCHSQPRYSNAHFVETPDCTSCHMPKGTAEKVPHIAWTDHRIRRRPDPVIEPNSQPEPGELVPFFQEQASARDLALAYYDLVLGGKPAFRETAWRKLIAVHDSQPGDLPVVTSLGYLAQMRGDNPRAMEFYREALKLDPVNVNANNNLAILLARSGQIAAAEVLWKGAFERNEALDQPGINLAIVECMLGNKAASVEALERVLLYSPDHRLAQRRLAAIQSGEETCVSPGGASLRR